MDIKEQIKALQYISELTEFNTGKKDVTRPQKHPLKPSNVSNIFQEVIPEQAGLTSDGLIELFRMISNTEGISPHAMLVLCDGKLVAKGEWAPYNAAYPHVSHSLCKSIVSMAVGCAISDGIIKLDETLGEWFTGYQMSNDIKKITVHNLLTMTSGVKFNEPSAIISKNWVEEFLKSDVKFKAGSEFDYNSINTYMLTVMICQKTGKTLSEFLNDNLFKRMGITNYYWETCPKGYEKGGWGLYMSIYDYAKLGQLYLQNGIWKGEQLISSEWISDSTSRQIVKVNTICNAGYGYHIWRTANNDGFMFSGMFGQSVYVFPKRNLVIAITAGSENVYPLCKTMDIISWYASNQRNFLKQPVQNSDIKYVNAAALRKGLERLNYGEPMYLPSSLSITQMMRFNLATTCEKDTLPATARMLTGRRIMLERNTSGLLPILIQVMNGNFERGIEQIYFSTKDGVFFTTIFGGDSVTQIPVGFDRQVLYFDLLRGGESYHVGTRGWLTSDEDGTPVLKIMLSFIETSCTKYMKLFFHEKYIIMKFEEEPKLYNSIEEAFRHILPSKNKFESTLSAILESDMAEYKIKKFLEPKVNGIFMQGEPPRQMK